LRILGFDPGVATVGYGAIDYDGLKPRLLSYGAIKTAAGLPLHVRLEEIFDDANTLIDKFKPDAIAIEELFFNTNVKTAITVAQGRGVLLLAAQKAAIPLFEYTPLQVKQAVVGYGRAEKRQIMEMTRILLHMEKIPRPDDAADALALAICHAYAAGSPLGLM